MNNYITIIGVVFATIWATSTEWASEKEALSLPPTPNVSYGFTQSSSSRFGGIRLPLSPFNPSPTSTRVMSSSPRTPEHYREYHPELFRSDDIGKTSPSKPLRINVSTHRSKHYEIEVDPPEDESSECIHEVAKTAIPSGMTNSAI